MSLSILVIRSDRHTYMHGLKIFTIAAGRSHSCDTNLLNSLGSYYARGARKVQLLTSIMFKELGSIPISTHRVVYPVTLSFEGG